MYVMCSYFGFLISCNKKNRKVMVSFETVTSCTLMLIQDELEKSDNAI